MGMCKKMFEKTFIINSHIFSVWFLYIFSQIKQTSVKKLNNFLFEIQVFRLKFILKSKTRLFRNLFFYLGNIFKKKFLKNLIKRSLGFYFLFFIEKSYIVLYSKKVDFNLKKNHRLNFIRLETRSGFLEFSFFRKFFVSPWEGVYLFLKILIIINNYKIHDIINLCFFILDYFIDKNYRIRLQTKYCQIPFSSNIKLRCNLIMFDQLDFFLKSNLKFFFKFKDVNRSSFSYRFPKSFLKKTNENLFRIFR